MDPSMFGFEVGSPGAPLGSPPLDTMGDYPLAAL